MSRALWAQRGIVGFVPSEAIDPKTELLAIEIDVVLHDHRRIPIRVPIRFTDLQERLSDPNDSTIAGARQWIIDRGLTRFDLSNPELVDEVSHVEAIYWVYSDRQRREPFLR
jgi:hypothetical protein